MNHQRSNNCSKKSDVGKKKKIEQHSSSEYGIIQPATNHSGHTGTQIYNQSFSVQCTDIQYFFKTM